MQTGSTVRGARGQRKRLAHLREGAPTSAITFADERDQKRREGPVVSSGPAPLLRYRLGAEHLNRLGARATAELLAEIGRSHGIEDDILRRLDGWRLLTPVMVRAAGADRFPPRVILVPDDAA